jgi:hypothetical protein
VSGFISRYDTELAEYDYCSDGSSGGGGGSGGDSGIRPPGSNFDESEARRSASVAHDELLLQYMSQK